MQALVRQGIVNFLLLFYFRVLLVVERVFALGIVFLRDLVVVDHLLNFCIGQLLSDVTGVFIFLAAPGSSLLSVLD